MRNIDILQEVKRYLAQADVSSSCTFIVNFNDFEGINTSDILLALLALQGAGYLKVIGISSGPDGHINIKPFSISEFREDISPECAHVILAEDYGEFDEKFELRYEKSNHEIWVNNIFLKGFKPGGCPVMQAFEISYYNVGKTLSWVHFAKALKDTHINRLSEVVRIAFNTIDYDLAKWWYPICETSKLRCETVYWADNSEEFKLNKKPRRNEWDPFERGEWSDD